MLMRLIAITDKSEIFFYRLTALTLFLINSRLVYPLSEESIQFYPLI